jgi:hypothetical protein
MNIDTGRIVSEDELRRMAAEERANYIPVPAKLTRQARRLAERGQPADLNSGALAKLAAAARRKRKMANESRRRNRR